MNEILERIKNPTMQYDCYEIKKVLPIDGNLSFEECERMLIPDDICLGILDENRDITSYVLKEDLVNVLKFYIQDKPVNLIATKAQTINTDIKNLKEVEKHIRPGLNRGVFIGKNKKEVNNLILYKNTCQTKETKFLTKEYKENIPDKIKKVLELCSQAADKISLPIFLIGGVVRDIIIGQKIIDIDITVEENAIEFSTYLKKEYSNFFKIKEIHEDFKTTKVIFTIGNEEIELDIASTRREKYIYPSSLPKIIETGCSIKEDILRRDFTINSMALSLNKNSFCRLIDPLEGYNDLIEKKIRVLHPLSFIDDPTRIIRALKFGIRFDCQEEEATKYLQENCLKSGLFNNLAGERVKSELKQTFNLNKEECLEKFLDEKIYFLLYKDILPPENSKKLATKTKQTIDEYREFINSKELTWLIYIGAIIMNSSKDEIKNLSEKLYLSGMETEVLIGGKGLSKNIAMLREAKTQYEIYEIIEGYFPESILINLIYTEDKEIKEKINLYLRELQNIKIYTTGKELIEQGITPGPIFGEILRELLKAKINKEISTHEDEMDYIRRFRNMRNN